MLSMVVDWTRDPARDPAWNLALDEALARAGRPPCLRVWQNAPSVIVGRFQDVDRTVDLAGCAEDGVRVVRRASGGAAVYTGFGTLNLSLILPRRSPDPRSGPPCDLGTLVATAVEDFGSPAAAARNGPIRSARLRARRCDLVHTAVRVTRDGDAGHYIASGNIASEDDDRPALADLVPGVTLESVRDAVLAAVENRFGPVGERPVNALERACRDYLYATRYGDVNWNLMGARGSSNQARQFTGH